jgi:NAD(P)-dependent dehydrogenase (short-subunit alcohol dehydrogenase family)
MSAIGHKHRPPLSECVAATREKFEPRIRVEGRRLMAPGQRTVESPVQMAQIGRPRPDGDSAAHDPSRTFALLGRMSEMRPATANWPSLPAPHSAAPCGRVDEIAAFVSFLVNGEAAYMTGASLTIDGGMSL